MLDAAESHLVAVEELDLGKVRFVLRLIATRFCHLGHVDELSWVEFRCVEECLRRTLLVKEERRSILFFLEAMGLNRHQLDLIDADSSATILFCICGQHPRELYKAIASGHAENIDRQEVYLLLLAALPL